MVLVKVLGFIDFVASLMLFSKLFSINFPIQFNLLIGGLLFIKSLFILKGDILSGVDLIASLTIFLSIFFNPWIFLLWILSLFLMSKSVASFI